MCESPPEGQFGRIENQRKAGWCMRLAKLAKLQGQIMKGFDVFARDLGLKFRSFGNWKGTKRWRKEERGGGERDEQRIKMCSVHVLVSHKKCNYYVLHTCTNKN